MTGDIQIFGAIGQERNEISFENVKSQIDAVKGSSELALHIWTPGGDVMEGEAIYNLLKNTGKKITTYIEGTCASIGSLIALAGDHIVMNETGRFMVHNPKISGLNTQADARELQHISMQLNKIKTLLIDVSAKKTGMSNEKLWALYDNETWLTAAEAKKMGFVDEIGDAIKAVAKVDLKHFHMKDKTVIQKLIAKIQNVLSVIKNEFNETLADGTAIRVMSDDEDWTGKQVTYEDGTPLPAGEHTLATGKILVVGPNATIAEVREAAPTDEQPKENQESPEDMKQIEDLKAQLAEALAGKEAAEAALNTQQAQAQQAQARATKFQNRVTEVEKELIEIKAEVSKTIGDTTPPSKGPVIKNSTPVGDNFDPMWDEAKKYFKNRNIIQNED